MSMTTWRVGHYDFPLRIDVSLEALRALLLADVEEEEIISAFLANLPKRGVGQMRLETEGHSEWLTISDTGDRVLVAARIMQDEHHTVVLGVELHGQTLYQQLQNQRARLLSCLTQRKLQLMVEALQTQLRTTQAQLVEATPVPEPFDTDFDRELAAHRARIRGEQGGW